MESFKSTKNCRFCYAGPESIKIMIEEDIALLRTKEGYKKDVETIMTSISGVKEYCVFNELEDYHLIENTCAD